MEGKSQRWEGAKQAGAHGMGATAGSAVVVKVMGPVCMRDIHGMTPVTESGRQALYLPPALVLLMAYHPHHHHDEHYQASSGQGTTL